MVTTPFRTTPNLGPALTETSAENYWDLIGFDVEEPSYQLGTVVTGNDGAFYKYVEAHAAIAADGAIAVADGATVSSAGTGYTAPVAVAIGDAFHARQDG